MSLVAPGAAFEIFIYGHYVTLIMRKTDLNQKIINLSKKFDSQIEEIKNISREISELVERPILPWRVAKSKKVHTG